MFVILIINMLIIFLQIYKHVYIFVPINRTKVVIQYEYTRNYKRINKIRSAIDP